jgi:gamma-glutamyltranspeptidase/glutathione hydrolase
MAADQPMCCETALYVADPNLNNCGGTRPTGLPFAGRSPVLARNGIAATSQALSTMCAYDVLKAGGNAIDAAIAANACEGVVEPMMNGIGGDLMMMMWDPKTKKVYGYNGSGRSSKTFSYAQMKEALGKDEYIPAKGPLPVSVPGTVKGWCDLHDRFGKMAWSKIFDSAIYYAREGHAVAEVIAAEWGLPKNDSTMTSGGKYPDALRGFMETFTVTDTKTGKKRAPKTGEIFKNPDLANTLEKIANGGCDEFYNGTIAKAFDAFGAVSGTNIKMADLSAHHGQWVEPGTIPNVTYRERYRLFELPPNPQGLAALQMMNLLEGYNLTKMGHNTGECGSLHLLTYIS